MVTISSPMPVTESRRNDRRDPHVPPQWRGPCVWSLCAASTLLLLVTGCNSNNNDSPPPAATTFSTFQSASVVIGQADFTSGLSNRGGGPGANTLRHPHGNPAVGSLYVPDYDNNRVLGYTTVPTTNGAAATFVLGQPDFISNTAGAGATGMALPHTVVKYQNKLLVADHSNNRVLIWNAIPTTPQAPADVVVGQPDMTTVTPGCTASTLLAPDSIAVINGSLVVADTVNNRVLIWDTIPTSNGTPADSELGQPDFTTCTPNTGGLSATSFNKPSDIVSNGTGTRVAVADSFNNRVLIFDAQTKTPLVVLGQPDFTSGTANNPALSATSLVEPYMLATDGTRLAVADSQNNRVLIWNQFPSCTPVTPATNCASTTPTNVVLGQPDFVSNTVNNDGTGSSSISARSLGFPIGLSFNGPNQLIVADAGNNRSLIFNAQ